VAILDADKEGFLRSKRALIQTMGRAARNIDGNVILYADEETDSIKGALEETRRRREKQLEYNRLHNINPKSISKNVVSLLPEELVTEEKTERVAEPDKMVEMPVEVLEEIMWKAVEKLDFEKAARIRDILSDKQQGARSVESSNKNTGSKRTQSKKYKRRNT
jgi:excinuclease ABC subunit B